MNTIIICSSKYGCAKDCAKSMQSSLSGSVSLTDINKINPQTIRLEIFDTVILGSSIYAGKISKKMRTFCDENASLLNVKRVGIFLCCAFPANLNTYMSDNFPAELLKNAVVKKDFGGETRLNKMKAVDKMLLKMASKDTYESMAISCENIESFIKEIVI